MDGRERGDHGPTGVVFDVKRFALHDGPGIRTTVFFKGCPLSCVWCHNPESQRSTPEILYRKDRCTGCGACVATCPNRAISLVSGHALTDLARCTHCGACATACRAGARTRCGKIWTVESLLVEVEKDTLFHDESGGGVTLSGGDPLMQPEFCRSLLQACKQRHIHTTVDTCGYASLEALRLIAEWTDLFLYDIKLVDDVRHQEWTGVPATPILDNLRQLDAWGHRIWIRIPIVPGVNNQPEELLRIAGFVTSIHHVEAVQLLPYHTAGAGKLEQLGRSPELDMPAPLLHDTVEEIAAVLRSELVVPVTVGG